MELRAKEFALREKEIALYKSMNSVRMAKRKRNKARESSAVNQAKLFGDALRGTLPKMPTDCVELTTYFRGVEQLFSDLEVEPELRICV